MKTNDISAEIGSDVFEYYVRCYAEEEIPQQNLTDLLTELRHMCKREEIDFDRAVEMSEIHFNCEV